MKGSHLLWPNWLGTDPLNYDRKQTSASVYEDGTCVVGHFGTITRPKPIPHNRLLPLLHGETTVLTFNRLTDTDRRPATPDNNTTADVNKSRQLMQLASWIHLDSGKGCLPINYCFH